MASARRVKVEPTTTYFQKWCYFFMPKFILKMIGGQNGQRKKVSTRKVRRS